MRDHEQAGWLEAARRGDDVAFTRLVTKIWKPVVRSVERLIGDHHEAQDLVQEALLRAHVNLHRLERGANFRAWVRRIARNVAVDRLRRRELAIELVEPESLQLVEESREGPAALETRRRDEHRLERLWRGVAALPSNERRVLFLFYGRGLPLRSIATECNGTLAGVKVTLHRGRRRLWEKMKRPASEVTGETARAIRA